jgi:hypothetical protein
MASKGLAADGFAREPGEGVKSRMERLLAKAGAGVALVGPQTTEDIDRRIREFRGDE